MCKIHIKGEGAALQNGGAVRAQPSCMCQKLSLSAGHITSLWTGFDSHSSYRCSSDAAVRAVDVLELPSPASAVGYAGSEFTMDSLERGPGFQGGFVACTELFP